MADREIIVIGGGVAGSTAALFAARWGRDTLLLSGGLPGGQLLNIGRIEDFPGFSAPVAGFELCPVVQDQALSAGAAFDLVDAVGLEPSEDGWAVATPDGSITAGAVIVATGSRQRPLGIPGEDRLAGRGISHCATCDGPLFRGRTVGVVGGGDSALQEALELADHVERVVVFHRGTVFSAQQTYTSRVFAAERIEVRFNTRVTEARGENALSSVTVEDTQTGAVSEVNLAGLFVYVGSEPNADLLPAAVERDHHGRVVTDARMRTALPGLLAAGDVRSDSAAQAVSAAGDGATAATTAHRFLAGESWRPVITASSA
jgi:thioredoxin reductase (NADPH)